MWWGGGWKHREVSWKQGSWQGRKIALSILNLLIGRGWRNIGQNLRQKKGWTNVKCEEPSDELSECGAIRRARKEAKLVLAWTNS